MPDTTSIALGRIMSTVTSVDGKIRVVAQQIDEVGNLVGAVGNRVDAVAQEQTDTRQRIELLYQEFQDYVEKDEWANVVSTARQELMIIRQELEAKFGHYGVVRRHTTGILQAADVAVVRQETIRTAAEELMLSCPRYWLAPALVALSAWLADKKPLAEKAIAEAIRRDDSKASLLFALICRRARRAEALSAWLIHYFQLQNPSAMDREVVTMLDALANGVFGGGALTACSTVIDGWLEELEQQAGFVDEQRKRWATALDAMTPSLAANEFPTLRQYSPTWPELEVSLAAARRNEVVHKFFEGLFTGETIVPPTLERAVDALLNSLVTNFDDEELPLRRKERYNELIIEIDGTPGRPREKRADIDRRWRAEAESLVERADFAGMLTNAALYPERTDTTLATRRYAVSRSREWIIAGFDDLSARDRARVPRDVEIACGSWRGTSQDGFNEQQLTSDLSKHYAIRIQEAVNAVGITGETLGITIVGGVVGAMVALIGLGSKLYALALIGFLLAAGLAAHCYFQYKNLDNVRQRKRQELESERDDAARILKAALAELTDLRRETAVEDGKADEVLDFLNGLSSPQFVIQGPEQARLVVA